MPWPKSRCPQPSRLLAELFGRHKPADPDGTGERQCDEPPHPGFAPEADSGAQGCAACPSDRAFGRRYPCATLLRLKLALTLVGRSSEMLYKRISPSDAVGHAGQELPLFHEDIDNPIKRPKRRHLRPHPKPLTGLFLKSSHRSLMALILSGVVMARNFVLYVSTQGSRVGFACFGLLRLTEMR
jgi:hypothetical protein